MEESEKPQVFLTAMLEYVLIFLDQLTIHQENGRNALTVLDHFLAEEASYWSMQALLRKAICKGKWVLIYGSRVIAVSDTKDEIVRFFNQYKKNNIKQQLPGAICVQVGNENKLYRLSMNSKVETDTFSNANENIDQLIYR